VEEKPGTDGTLANFHLLKNWERFVYPNFFQVSTAIPINSHPEPTDAMRIQTAKLPQD
jgi:hypothetical protein